MMRYEAYYEQKRAQDPLNLIGFQLLLIQNLLGVEKDNCNQALSSFTKVSLLISIYIIAQE